jgi:hypothetical protein
LVNNEKGIVTKLSIFICKKKLLKMQALYNHGGELIAYHYQNMLLHPDHFEVLGLVLGNCVFDHQAKLLGKLFQKNVYNLEGEVLANQPDDSLALPLLFDNTKSVIQAWHILTKIKDHVCPWVKVKHTWSRTSLAEHLYVYDMAD